MKRKTVILCATAAVVLLAAAAAGSKGFFRDPAYFMNRLQNKVTQKYHEITKTEPQLQEEIIQTADHHKVLLDHPKGYSVSLPEDMSFDLSIAPEQIKAYRDGTTVVLTREWAPYEDVFYMIDNYLNQYYLNEEYQAANRITVSQNEKFTTAAGARAQLITLHREPAEGSTVTQNNYSYFFVESLTGKQAFFRMMFKSDNPQTLSAVVDEAVASFEEIPLKGGNVFHEDYAPVIPQNWNEETKKLYRSIQSGKKFYWGLFVDGAYTDAKRYQWYDDLEKKVDFPFDFSLHYVNLNHGFPVEELTKMYEEGKLTELTLQISYHANDNLFGKNINFDVYDGLCDDEIRAFAKGAKEFGHPFLFRLNNEMNSDWVNYSGVAALSDPEIFIENWRRIYRIFEEEGVDNAIWVFNPNAEDCPPCHWNSYISYYPGNEYVHIIGLTGYNTGTYYADLYHEKWRTFDEIYQEPYEKYMQVFSQFPFMITEFASSSVGGDKAAWITDMFASLKKYPNIRMALWWSSADYDMREEHYKTLALPYWLDETDETTAAFREGIQSYK